MVPSLDLRPERYTHYYKEEFPASFWVPSGVWLELKVA